MKTKFEGIRIVDSFHGEVSVAPNKANVFKTEDSAGSSLVVKIPMTHSGIQTKNKGLYLPSKMMKGKDSFIKPYQKPVQVGHGGGFFGGDSEPIGRVKAVNYVETLDPLEKDLKLADFYRKHLDKNLEIADEGSKSLAQHILR
jgi:hypothetical protein